MQLSKYTLFVNDYPSAGEHLVYNTRTQALVKINRELKDALDRIGTFERVPDAHAENLKTLFGMGVLVKDEEDERRRFDAFMEQKKYGIDRSHFIASILTTYNCNFACTYCFEESTRTSSQKLDRGTADAAMEWIKRRVEKNGVRELILNYYGGEPLLNRPMIEHISWSMKEWCEARGVRLGVMLQTNGALLTKELVREYKKFGLYKAKISVDGTKEVHDRQRPMRGSGEGTFDTVMRNIADNVGEIQISIAAGYDNGDPSGVLRLLDYFEEVGIARKLHSFTYSAIHPGLGPKGHAHDLASPGCMANYATDTILAADAKIKAAMKAKGMNVKSGLMVTMCPVTSGDKGVTIDTQGGIYKCNAMLGHPELAVGSIWEESYNDTHRMFMGADNWKKCGGDCPFAPICNTGCRLFAFFKTKDFTAQSCERDYMEKFIPGAIVMEYENRMKEKRATARTPAVVTAS